MENMLSSLSLLFLVTVISQQTEALKCYRCSVFQKPDYEGCKNVGPDTPTEECEGDDICTAVGYNHVRNDTYSEYTNIRRCGSKNLCLGAYYAYGENLRNCHVCFTDLCNAGPLIPGLTGVATASPPPVVAKKPKASGRASADSSGNAKASGSVD